MLSIFDGLRDLRFIAIVFRMFLALLCGGVIGIERSYKNRPAGFRTHILLCSAAAVASMTGIYLYIGAHLPADLSRIGAQVISGLGFNIVVSCAVDNRFQIEQKLLSPVFFIKSVNKRAKYLCVHFSKPFQNQPHIQFPVCHEHALSHIACPGENIIFQLCFLMPLQV